MHNQVEMTRLFKAHFVFAVFNWVLVLSRVVGINHDVSYPFKHVGVFCNEMVSPAAC